MGLLNFSHATPSDGAATTVASGLSYEPFGPVTGMTFGNGVAQSRSYDEDYRLTALNDVGDRVIGGRSILRTLLRSLTYGYYPTNTIASITDLQTPSNTQSFNYDALQRLQAASGAYGSYQYGYDADGNRLSETQGTATTSYGDGAGSDLLSSTSVGGVTAESFGYTADGRLATLAPGIGSPAGPAITALSYNQAGQYASATSGSTALAGYTYDGFGQRAEKTISATAGARYVYNQGGMLLEETNAAGAAQADYIYLDGQPVAVLNGTTLYDLHDDHLGTPQFATNASQVKEWAFTYAPFGDSASVSGTITQNLRLPGQYYDVESGWNHNGFRDYLPNFGRYLQPDPLGMQGSARLYNSMTGMLSSEEPIGFAGGPNFYEYAGDNPTLFDDPFGLQSSYSGPYGSQQPLFPMPWSCVISISCFYYYGNYGGPGWTGGQWQPWETFGDPWSPDPNPPAGLALPVDAQDACYMDHDRCYARARHPQNGKCSSPSQESADDRSCDGELMQCLQGINSSNDPSNNVWSHIAQPVFSIKEMLQ